MSFEKKLPGEYVTSCHFVSHFDIFFHLKLVNYVRRYIKMRYNRRLARTL